LKRYPKIKCHFRGCGGEIDLVKEMERMLYCTSDFKKARVIELSWCIHTVMCPKCRNPVAQINVGPETWVSFDDVEKEPTQHTINNPRNGKTIVIDDGEGASLDPYLKKWARTNTGNEICQNTSRPGKGKVKDNDNNEKTRREK